MDTYRIESRGTAGVWTGTATVQDDLLSFAEEFVADANADPNAGDWRIIRIAGEED